MRIVIAPDSFKESLSAVAASAAMADGVLRAAPDAEILQIPMADGGEGTVDAMVAAAGGIKRRLRVRGPMGQPVDAEYGLLGDETTAVIEMAAASGLALVPAGQRDPRRATSYGTGQLIAEAIHHGCRRVIIGIGGSATNDGGAGMAQALGYSLRDSHGNELAFGGAALRDLQVIDDSGAHPNLSYCEFLVACDVDNPLCGPRGASHVYGPQKGATPEVVEELDAALQHLGEKLKEHFNLSVLDLPGAGAAGGLGAGLAAFTAAKLQPGFDIVAETVRLREQLRGADLVLTGEGKLDDQSSYGKTPVGVARMAKGLGIPCIALAGALRPGYQAAYKEGLTAAFSLCAYPMGQEHAMLHAHELLLDCAENTMRAWMSGRGRA